MQQYWQLFVVVAAAVVPLPPPGSGSSGLLVAVVLVLGSLSSAVEAAVWAQVVASLFLPLVACARHQSWEVHPRLPTVVLAGRRSPFDRLSGDTPKEKEISS